MTTYCKAPLPPRDKPSVTVVDYGAGNLCSVLNALDLLRCKWEVAKTPDDIKNASHVIFPGVGNFEDAVNSLKARKYWDVLVDYIKSGSPFLGMCIGLQLLFRESEESPSVQGFNVIDAPVRKFTTSLPVPHIGWNSIHNHSPPVLSSILLTDNKTRQRSLEDWVMDSGLVYFVHSYKVDKRDFKDTSFICLTSSYGGEEFVSYVRKGDVIATQFHPEKSGWVGLQFISRALNLPPYIPAGFTSFLQPVFSDEAYQQSEKGGVVNNGTVKREHASQKIRDVGIAKRVIACLDIRSDDNGILTVTKGDQYDVREGGKVRSLGCPREMAESYFLAGVDEIVLLSIKSYNTKQFKESPLLKLLKEVSKKVFVPICIGGGIRDIKQEDGSTLKAVDVAKEYFLAGADKVSIGSDAVYASEDYWAQGGPRGNSSIEQISKKFGNQAVVVSVDAKRVYIKEKEMTPHTVIPTSRLGPSGESMCWYQCTVKGGREMRNVIDVVKLVQACQILGAGEILLNCIDQDGTNSGFDIELINLVKANVSIPVIASSGAGNVAHFVEVFQKSKADAALAAGILHRGEVGIKDIKRALMQSGVYVRSA